MKNAYDQWRDKANKIYAKYVHRAQTMGIVENFGQKEARQFRDEVFRDDRLSYQEQADLSTSLSEALSKIDDNTKL